MHKPGGQWLSMDPHRRGAMKVPLPEFKLDWRALSPWTIAVLLGLAAAGLFQAGSFVLFGDYEQRMFQNPVFDIFLLPAFLAAANLVAVAAHFGIRRALLLIPVAYAVSFFSLFAWYIIPQAAALHAFARWAETQAGYAGALIAPTVLSWLGCFDGESGRRTPAQKPRLWVRRFSAGCVALVLFYLSNPFEIGPYLIGPDPFLILWSTTVFWGFVAFGVNSRPARWTSICMFAWVLIASSASTYRAAVPQLSRTYSARKFEKVPLSEILSYLCEPKPFYAHAGFAMTDASIVQSTASIEIHDGETLESVLNRLCQANNLTYRWRYNGGCGNDISLWVPIAIHVQLLQASADEASKGPSYSSWQSPKPAPPAQP